MLYYIDIEGVVQAAIPDTVTQGTVGVKEIIIIAPFPSSTVVTAFITLPNGIMIYPEYVGRTQLENGDYGYKFTPITAFEGKIPAPDGVTVNVWKLTLDRALTQQAGTVNFTFSFTDQLGNNLTSTQTTMTVGKATPFFQPTVTEQNLNKIATYLSAAQNAAGNAEAAAKAAQEQADRASPWDVVITPANAQEELDALADASYKSVLFLNVDFTALTLGSTILFPATLTTAVFRGCNFGDVTVTLSNESTRGNIEGVVGKNVTLASFFVVENCDVAAITDASRVAHCKAGEILGSQYITGCTATTITECGIVSACLVGTITDTFFVDPYSVSGRVVNADVGKVVTLTADGSYKPAPLPQKVSLSVDNNTYVVTVNLLDKNNAVISTSSIDLDLPLESVVVDAELSDDGKTLILELKNGNTVEIPVSDILSGVAINIEDGSGKGSIQQTPDQENGVAEGYFNFTVNTNAIALDSSLADPIPYGARGDFASSFGGKGAATGKRSHQEGSTNIAKAKSSHVEGVDNAALEDAEASHIEGWKNTGNAIGTHVEGRNNVSQAGYTHVEGSDNTAEEEAEASHIEGNRNILRSYSKASHIEGTDNATKSNSEAAHIEGKNNEGGGVAPHIEGVGNTTGINSEAAHIEGKNNKDDGISNHVEGEDNETVGDCNHVEGQSNVSYLDLAHIEGQSNRGYSDLVHIEGRNNKAREECVHIEGEENDGRARGCHLEGGYNKVEDTAEYGHAEGYTNILHAPYGHIEGRENLLYGLAGHVEGGYNKVYGDYSHGQGENNLITEDVGFASGIENKVRNRGAQALGRGLITDRLHQIVVGTYNELDGDAIFIVGNGTDDDNRSNALVVYEDGTIVVGNVGQKLYFHYVLISGQNQLGYQVKAHVMFYSRSATPVTTLRELLTPVPYGDGLHIDSLETPYPYSTCIPLSALVMWDALEAYFINGAGGYGDYTYSTDYQVFTDDVLTILDTVSEV